MNLRVDIAKLSEAILDKKDRDHFEKKYPREMFTWGIEIKTFDKWTTKQQGKIWRDFTLAGRLLETTPNAIYSMLKTNPRTERFFHEETWIGHAGRGKTITTEKGLSQFTKEDCAEAIDVILPFMEEVINNIYQEIVIVNWSCRQNKLMGKKDYEFTGEPYKNGNE